MVFYLGLGGYVIMSRLLVMQRRCVDKFYIAPMCRYYIHFPKTFPKTVMFECASETWRGVICLNAILSMKYELYDITIHHMGWLWYQICCWCAKSTYGSSSCLLHMFDKWLLWQDISGLHPFGTESGIFRENCDQYHDCWWPGALRCQAINSHNIGCRHWLCNVDIYFFLLLE